MNYTAATEGIAYKSIRNNIYYKNQKEILMPKTERLGFGNILLMLSPNRAASMRIINSKFIAFSKSQLRLYTTDTMINTKIGKTKLHKNLSVEAKQYFTKQNNSILKFRAPISLETDTKAGRSYMYDLGQWNDLYFKYKYKRNLRITCSQYIDFIVEKINSACKEGYENKILYISYAEWRKAGAKIGITIDCLNNPISIFMTCLYRYCVLLKPLVDLNADIIIANEESGEFIKLHLSEEVLEPGSSKSMFNRFKMQLKKMSVIVHSEDTNATDKSNDESDPTASVTIEKMDPYDRAKREFVVNSMVKRFTGTSDTNTASDNIFTVDDDGTANTESGDNEVSDQEKEEIDDTVNNFLDEHPELIDSDPDDLMDAVENEVKKNVYINKFIPERSQETLKLIEVASKKQDKILSQDVDELKSKIIDETDFSNVVKATNPYIKSSKYVNFDKDYVEKKYKKDVDAAVAALADADVKMFIEDIKEEDTSDLFNQKKTLTYTIRDENNKVHTLKFDVPIIIDDCYIYTGGSKKHILKQRIFKPIVKIGSNQVQICTMYNKATVMRYGKSVDAKVIALQKFLTKNNEKYKVYYGNAKVKNAHYKTDLDFDYLSKSITKFTIGNNHFILDIKEAIDALDSFEINTTNYKNGTKIPAGYRVAGNKKEPIDLINGSISDTVFAILSPDEKKQIKIGNSNTRFAYARVKILDEFIPTVLFLLFCEGFTEVMKKCEINYELFDDEKDIVAKYGKDYQFTKGVITTSNNLIVWDKYPYENQLLLNGLNGLPISEYPYEALDSKDTYIDMLSMFYKSANQSYNLDQYKDFLLDPKTKEILSDFNMPTDLTGVFFYACKMLVNNQYAPTNDLINTRIRGNEIVSQIVYQYVAQAYNKYRKSGFKNKSSFSISQNAIITALTNSSLVENESIMNPVATLEKTRAVTIKGSTSEHGITLSGFNKTDNYSMQKRAYDESMLGVFGITTPSDANNGIIRQLALEPNITSTNGYVDITPHDQINELNPTQLFTPAELLTPPGIRHDDPQRSAMMKGQTTHMVLTDDASPVLMGNKVESMVAYHLHNEFCFVAKQDGKVVDVQDGVYILEYKDGSHDSFDTKPVIRNNPSDGMYVEIQFKTDLVLGSKFKKNEVVATESRAFTKDDGELTASMNIGVLAKVAIASIDDILEDSEPMTKKLSERLGYWAIVRKSVSLPCTTKVGDIVKIGDHVNIGDVLIKYDKYGEDEEEMRLINEISKNMSSDQVSEFIDSTSTTLKSTDSGEIIGIKMYCTVELDELSPSMRKLVQSYYNQIKKKDSLLNKYKNENDNKFYKCGQLITESPEKSASSYGKIKNEYVGKGVLIEFYIRHKDIIKKGDKTTNYCALKGVVSNIIPEGQEPWSEFRPEEEVSAFISPLSILARKTPSIYISLFGNKVMIELKRRVIKDYFGSSAKISDKRKEFMRIYIGTFDILDPTKHNSNKYLEMFNAKSDDAFDKWMKKFRDNDKMYPYWETVEYEYDAKLENIEKAAKFLNIPLYENVVVYHTNDDNTGAHAIVTPTPCPVGYTHIKRMPQSVHHKNSGSTSLDQRNHITGQVTGKDKNGRTTDVETYALTTYGAENTLKELLGFRADDEAAKTQALAELQTDGYVMLEDLSSFQTDKVAINTLDAYYTAMGFKTNIVFGGDAISMIPKTNGDDISF